MTRFLGDVPKMVALAKERIAAMGPLDPGQFAYEVYTMTHFDTHGTPWSSIGDNAQASWAAVEAACAPQMPADVAALVERLSGIYRVPITDGHGAVGGGEEPDNPNEFVRQFPTVPIQLEAASALERLHALAQAQAARANAADEALRTISATLGGSGEWSDQRQMILDVHRQVAEIYERAEAAEAKLRDADSVIQRLNSGAELQAIMAAHNDTLAKLRETVEVIASAPVRPDCDWKCKECDCGVRAWDDRRNAFLSTMEPTNDNRR